MLTPQMIQQANKVTGNNISATGTSPVTSRAAQIRALGNSPNESTTPDSEPAESDTDTLGADTAKQTLAGIETAKQGVEEGADIFADPETDVNAGSKTSVTTAVGDELQKTGGLLHAGASAVIGGAQSIFAPIAATIQKLSQTASDNPIVQGFASSPEVSAFLDAVNQHSDNTKAAWNALQAAHPAIARSIADSVGVAGTVLGGEEGSPEADIGGTIKDTASAIGDKVNKMTTPNPNPGPELSEQPSAPGLVEKAQLAATKGNQIPTLENAAQKPIPIPGSTQISDPLARYDEHVATEQKALKDAKADTALGNVGSKIGTAFKTEVATQRETGGRMASELDKISEKPTDATSAQSNFKNELTKNGLAVDEDGSLLSGRTSKVTDQDKALLEDYNHRLTELGPKPTVAELDAFLSRVPDEINVYKAKNAITGTTNGERIIKGNLTELRNQLDPVKTGKGYLKDYAAARSEYAKRAKFIQNGVGHLGKITESGDFAKDASLAKSSVQSILNNGKKDWLLELERRTGYPAIDDATLASQAMKDVGDYRGNSLLELLSSGKGGVPEVPTSLGKVAGQLLNFGKKKFAGTPIEQTRRFLQSLKK